VWVLKAFQELVEVEWIERRSWSGVNGFPTTFSYFLPLIFPFHADISMQVFGTKLALA
jgi:hypothetical protein